MNGFLAHFLITLKLNFRNKQALVMGYVVPLFFLVAFGSIFRSGRPPLVREIGQILTITALGGACFGMPVSLVSERERGVWRRYRLAPIGTGTLILSTMLSRFLIIISGAAMQYGLAMCLYGMPAPEYPLQLAAAFTCMCFACLGMGLIIAAVANSTGSVQALGNCLFLPMIIIGGVGVPLRTLPIWAQHVATFLPGRYAVESITACMMPLKEGANQAALNQWLFSLLALALIGAASCLIGSRIFRWEPEQRLAKSAKWWVLLGLLVWAAVGISAEYFKMVKVPAGW